MIDFAGFSSGYLAQQEQDERKRRELAQAFGEFQRRNPTATAAQFQQFIDSMSGGRNYLAGGMPSGEALRAVINQADQERNRQEIERNRKRFRENIATQNEISGLVDGILLSSEDPGEGGYSAENYSNMVGKLKDRLGVQDFSEIGFDPTNMFTPDRRRIAVANRIRQYLPTLESLIESAGGRNLDESDLAPFNLPKALVQPLLRRAERIETERREETGRRLRGEMYERAMSAVQQGNGTDVHANLSTIYGENKIPARDSQFMQGMQAQVDRATNEARNLVEREKKQFANSAREALLKSDRVKAAIVLNDDQEVMQAMLVTLDDQLTDQDFVSLFGASKEQVAANPGVFLGPYINRTKADLGFRQRNLASQARDQSQDLIQKETQAYVEKNIKRADEYFGSVGKTSPLAGKAEGVAGIVARSLAGTYDMNDGVLGAMSAVFSNLPDNFLQENPNSAGALKQLVINDPAFQDAVRLGGTTAEAKAAIANTVYSRQPPLMGFDAFISKEGNAIAASMKEAKKDFNEVVNLYKDNPNKLDAELDRFSVSLKRGLDSAVQKIEKLKRLQGMTYDGLGWVDQNQSGEYSDEAMDELIDAMESSVKEILGDIATQKGANQIARTNAQQTPTTAPSAAYKNVEAIPNVVERVKEATPYMQQPLPDMRTRAGSESSLLKRGADYIFGSTLDEQVEIQKAQMIKDFLDTRGVIPALEKDSQAVSAFSRENNQDGSFPGAFNYLMNSNHPAVVNWFNTEEGRRYAEIFNRPVPNPQ